jgi:hypothetical protein
VADGGERVWRSIDFTPARRAVFLHHLAQDGNVRTACSRVPISAQAAYLARRRDAVFRAGWDAALVHSREHALQVLANRALDGIREEVWHRGELVGHRVRHDTRLLLAHLGRLDARCQDARALDRAERFDELLALVAGARFPAHMADRHEWGTRHVADPILPMAPRRYVIARGEDLQALAEAAVLEEAPNEALDRAEVEMYEAQAEAEAERAQWDEAVDAVAAALEAGEEPVVAELAPEPLDGELPYEVKSLDGGALRAAGRGREFPARTPFGSSTWSPAPRALGVNTKARRGRAGGEAARIGQSSSATGARREGASGPAEHLRGLV